MSKAKLCKICRQNPATVPDRNSSGRLTNQVCGRCHSLRLKGDFQHILELRKAWRVKP